MTLAPLIAALTIAASAGPAQERFALVLGNNQGSAGRARLWFAERDAERFANALVELGGFSRGQVTVVRGGDVATVRAQLSALEERIRAVRASGSQTLLVVFFSGHADARGLELGFERLPFDELRAAMTGSAADARVAIVDACDSGALTQVKGARPAPEVNFPIPADEGARGVAYLASTAAGESAQESAALGASFFTFHLEAALRGAADADRDGHVTLAEAFRYASTRTIAGTAATASGPQHPTYDIRMAGRGDLVLTSVGRGEARLALPGDESLGWLVYARGGALVAETRGGATLALPAGRYVVERRSASERATAEVLLAAGETRDVGSLVLAPAVASRGKGGEREATAVVLGGATLGSALLDGVALAPGFRLEGGIGFEAVELRAGVELLRADASDRGLSYRFESLGASAAALVPVWRGPVQVLAGARGGYAWNRQTLADSRSFAAGEAFGGGVVAVGKNLGPIALEVQGSVTGHVFRLNGATEFRPRAAVAGLVGVGF